MARRPPGARGTSHPAAPLRQSTLGNQRSREGMSLLRDSVSPNCSMTLSVSASCGTSRCRSRNVADDDHDPGRRGLGVDGRGNGPARPVGAQDRRCPGDSCRASQHAAGVNSEMRPIEVSVPLGPKANPRIPPCWEREPTDGLVEVQQRGAPPVARRRNAKQSPPGEDTGLAGLMRSYPRRRAFRGNVERDATRRDTARSRYRCW